MGERIERKRKGEKGKKGEEKREGENTFHRFNFMGINGKCSIEEPLSTFKILLCSEINKIPIGHCVHSFVVAIPEEEVRKRRKYCQEKEGFMVERGGATNMTL